MTKIIAGLVLLTIGLWAIVSWWSFVWYIIRGLATILLILGGLTLIGSGINDTGRKSKKQNRIYPFSFY